MEVSCSWKDEKDRKWFCVSLEPSVIIYHEGFKEFSKTFLSSPMESNLVNIILDHLKKLIPDFEWKCNVSFEEMMAIANNNFELNVFGDSERQVFVLKIFIEDFNIKKISSHLLRHIN